MEQTAPSAPFVHPLKPPNPSSFPGCTSRLDFKFLQRDGILLARWGISDCTNAGAQEPSNGNVD